MAANDDELAICYINDLPTELLVMSFSYLPLRELLRCDLVCRRFHQAIHGSLLLKYHIALARVGAVDNIHSKLSTVFKLQRLEEQEKAWLYLNPSRRDRIPIPKRFGSFDLSGGVLVGARSPEDDESLPSSADEDEFSACELLGTTLPSVISGDGEDAVRSWSRNVGFSVYGLGIDTNQDLAIVIQSRNTTGDPFNIHLMALSSFTHHPLAAQPIVQHSANVPVSQISVRCMGTLVGVMLHSFDADLFQQTLLIFDWNTGESKACIESTKEGRYFDDFGFLSSDTIVLPVRKPGPATLDVYKFDTRKISRRSERISRGALPLAVRIGTFGLPAMRDPLEVSVNPIGCNAEPPIPHSQLSGMSCPGASSSTPRQPPYYLDGATSLLTFSFMVCHGHSANTAAPLHERYTLVVQRAAFMRRVEELLRNTNGRWVGSQWKTISIPWTNWGPHISRWLTMKHLSWACFMSGSRLILSPIIPEDRSLCHLRILDFNPYVVAKERSKRDESSRKGTLEYCEELTVLHSSDRWARKGKGKEVAHAELDDEQSEVEQRVLVKLVDDTQVIPEGKLWAAPVQSHLPYRQVTTRESFPYANVVIDEERIGGILVNEAGDLVDVEILTM